MQKIVKIKRLPGVQASKQCGEGSEVADEVANAEKMKKYEIKDQKTLLRI